MRAYQQEAGLSNINIVVELHRAGARAVEVDHFVGFCVAIILQTSERSCFLC